MKPGALLVVLGLSAVVGLGVRKYAGADAVPVVPEVLEHPARAEVPKEDHSTSRKPGAVPAGPNNPVFPENLEVRGFARWGHRVSLQLSDGSRLTDRDKELIKVERNSVTICTAHAANPGIVCPACKKYPVKPALMLASERPAIADKPKTNLTPGVHESPPKPVQYSGAANTGTTYTSERVIPVNGEVSSAFTISPMGGR
jgi:hypothetical protein